MDYLEDNSACTSSGQEVVKQWGDLRWACTLCYKVFVLVWFPSSLMCAPFVITQLGFARVPATVINTACLCSNHPASVSASFWLSALFVCISWFAGLYVAGVHTTVTDVVHAHTSYPGGAGQTWLGFSLALVSKGHLALALRGTNGEPL